MIGKAFKTDSVPVYFEKRFRENINLNDHKTEKGVGKIFKGQAGSGKTYRLCEMLANSDNLLALTFTKKAIENVKSKLKHFGVDKEWANEICFTFDNYFFEFNGRKMDRLKN